MAENKFLGSRAFYILIGILAIVAIYFVYSSRPGPEITAQGESSLKATPDLVSVYVLIESRNSTAELAQASNAVLATTVLNRLALLGFANDSIQLSSYNVYPDYDWSNNKQTLKGYIVSQQLTLYVKDFSQVSKVVNEVVAAGGLVSSINFELSSAKQNAYKTQLLTEASADARVKAQAIASGLGRKLGALVMVETQDAYYPGPINYYSRAGSGGAETYATDAAAVKDAAQKLAPQDIDMQATVAVKYRLA